MKTPRILQPLSDALFAVFWFRPDFRVDKNYLEAQAWYKAFKPLPGLPDAYEAALRHAERAWDGMVRIDEQLDRKAEWTFLVASGGAGVSLARDLGWPALLLFCLAMLASLRSRLPGGSSFPMQCKDLLNYIGPEKPVAGILAASLHPTVNALTVVTLWKARTVRGAGWWVLAAAAAAGLARYLAA